MAEEKLIIDVQTKDSLTPALEKAKVGVKSFADEAKAQFGKIGQNVSALPKALDATSAAIERTEKKATSFADIAGKKFSALGKAAVGIFTADVVAKALGFSSALGAINIASEALAGSFSRAVKELLGFGPAYEQAQRAAVRYEEAVANARANREKNQISRRETIPGLGSVSFDLSPFLGLPGTQFDAAAEATEAQRRRILELGERFRSVVGAEARDEFGTSAASNAAFKAQIKAEFAAASSGIRKAVEDAITRQIIADSRAAVGALGGGGGGGQGAFVGPIQPGASLNPNIPAGFEFITGGGGSAFNDTRGARFAAIQAAQQRQQLLAAQAAFPSIQAFEGAAGSGGRSTPQGSSALLGKLLGLGKSGIEELVSPFSKLTTEIAKAGPFALQLSQSMDELGRSIKSGIGSQVVFGAFNAFSSFFERAIQGQATLRDLGRSFVSLGAQILSQQAAFRLISFLFPSFGFGVGGGGVGAITGGGGGLGGLGFAGAGGGGVPLPLMSGNGGGHQVAVSLNVASIDPRNAAAVILEQMPAIQRGLAAAIVSGQSRNLRMAVGSV